MPSGELLENLAGGTVRREGLLRARASVTGLGKGRYSARSILQPASTVHELEN
jgi:hypothetical protein